MQVIYHLKQLWIFPHPKPILGARGRWYCKFANGLREYFADHLKAARCPRGHRHREGGHAGGDRVDDEGSDLLLELGC